MTRPALSLLPLSRYAARLPARLLARLLLGAMASFAVPAQAAVTPINLAGPVSSWDIVMKGAAFDPGNDQQASANPGVDIVGTDFDATLFTIYDDKGTVGTTADDELAFRVRVGGANSQGAFGGYMWIGMDVDLDGDLDAFIGMSGNGKTGAQFSGAVNAYEAGTGLNTSPSTSSADNPVLVATLLDNGTNYSFDTVNGTTDPLASSTDINLDAVTDRFVSFKVSWDALRTALNSKPLTDPSGNLIGSLGGGVGITDSTPIAYTLSTSTNANNVNSDVGGYDNKNDDLSVSFADQGAFSPPLSASNIFPVITSDGGGDAASLDIDEGQTAVTAVVASDANGDTVSYAISGGADAAFFSISGGNLSFTSAPAFASPQDSDGGNNYVVIVTASDGRGGSDSQTITVNVQQVAGDIVAPTVLGIARHSPLAATTNADTVTFRVSFDEAVLNVSADDFVVTGAASGSASISSVVAQSGSVYDVSVTGITSANGSLSLGFAAAQNITDSSSNALAITTPSGANESYTLDNQAPALSAASVSGSTLTLSYDEALASGSVPAGGDYTVLVDGVPVSVTAVTINGSDVELTLASAALNTATVTLSYAPGATPLQDATGNTVASLSGSAVTNNSADATAPTVLSVVRQSPLTATTNADTVTFRVSFDEAVLNVSADDFVVTGAASGSASISSVVAQSGSVYDVSITGITSANGSLSLGFAAAQNITDSSSNALAITTPSGANESYTLDNQAPDGALVTAISTDSGASTSDGITLDRTLVFSGTAEASADVEVFLNGVSLGTVSASALGAWSLDHSATTLAEGSYTLMAQATDAVGNVGAAGMPFLSVRIDVTAPAAATLAQNGAALSSATPTFSGTAEPLSQVSVTINGQGYVTSADATGAWSVLVSNALADSSYAVSLTATDVAGNATVDSTSQVTIDTLAPPAPAVTGISADTGSSASDAITSDQTLVISGSAEANASVEVFVNGISIGSTTANGSGVWTFDHSATALDEGNQSLTARATDAAGNVSPLSVARVVIIDISAPTTPTLAQQGSTLADNTPLLSGTAEALASITVTVDGTDYVTQADASGNWSATVTTALANTSHAVVVTSRDVAGNSSVFNGSLTIDTTLDSDGDGISDLVEGSGDTDNDTTPDYLDTDSDNDGIPDSVEGVANTDGDALPNYRDTDSDGDGRLDSAEGRGDDDGDGIENYVDANDNDGPDGDLDNDGLTNEQEDDLGSDGNSTDTDGDGIDDATEVGGDTGNPIDTDGDGIPDYLDPDDNAGDTNGNDSDNDGIADGDECPDFAGAGCPDTDGDGLPDYLDNDDDNDGIPTTSEGTTRDTDGDGVPDYLDEDDDGDGLLTRNEDLDSDADGNPATTPGPDVDGDGIPAYLDPNDALAGFGDADADGLADNLECTGLPCVDSDSDGQPDYMDADDDNDGVDTVNEDLDASGDPRNDDTDGDGVPNYLDTDDDNDGVETLDEDRNTNTDPRDDDLDGDNIPDYLDADSNNSAGTGDNAGDSDGDGLSDRIECPAGIPCRDNDGDGVPDYMDKDDDGDGIDTRDEDVDGNGDPRDDDADNDGVPDYLDNDDDNDGVPSATEGTGDSDGDNIPDYLDPEAGDSDGDGLGDGVECPDGVPCPDSDGDGFADFIDPDDDNDGINTADEDLSGNGDPRDDDIDGDGVPNYLDTDDDNDGQPSVTEGIGDTDGDGIPDYLDGDSNNNSGSTDGSGDSDNDGRSDSQECPSLPCADSDGDGVPDYLDGASKTSSVSGTVGTGVQGAGSAGVGLLLALGLVVLRRAGRLAVVLLLLPGLASAAIDERLYAGAGLGWSFLTPDVGDSGYRLEDEHDVGVTLFAGYQWRPHWAAEILHADLGEARIEPRAGVLLKATGVTYNFTGVSALYYLKGYRPGSSGWDLFGRLGLGSLDGAAKGTDDESGHDSQLFFGAGLEHRWSRGWMVRAEVQTYDADASQVLLSVGKRFGASATETREPVPMAPPVTMPADVVSEPQDSDRDGVEDARDACPETAAGASVNNIGCSEDFLLDVRNILFASGSAELTDAGKAAVARVATALEKSRVAIDVIAHTDSVGAAAANQALSEQRASTVVNELVARGVAAQRLQAIGKGESAPVADNATAEGRAANRRVEFVVQEEVAPATAQ